VITRLSIAFGRHLKTKVLLRDLIASGNAAV
jgi:hypothetical protein